jgi:hypothetical protein
MANLILLAITGNFLVAFLKLNYKIEYIAGAVAILILLILRFVLVLRSRNNRQVRVLKVNVDDKVK